MPVEVVIILIKDGYNGYIFSSGDYISLAYKMRLLSNQSDEEIKIMGLNSLELSKSYSNKEMGKNISWWFIISIRMLKNNFKINTKSNIFAYILALTVYSTELFQTLCFQFKFS